MSCIFVTIFSNEKYVDMFYILFESLMMKNNVHPVLVYTSSEFRDKIKLKINNDMIHFKINDSYTTNDAYKAKLDFFKLSTPYTKVLYLDVDSVVNEDINNVFDLCTENVVYAIEEGRIKDPSNSWGNSLFDYTYDDVAAFSSSLLLFNNSDQIKELFHKIQLDMSKRDSRGDQPYIVYHCIKHAMYKSIVVNIYHAKGNIQDMEKAIDKITTFLETSIHIGASNVNVKRVKMPKKMLVGHNRINEQESWWKDTFDIRVVKDEIVVKRTDENGGWGQDIMLPIKCNKILIYNGFPFYYDKIGCILDFCQQYSIEVDLVMTHDTSWLNIYKSKYTFNVLPNIPYNYNHYIFVVLLASNDPTFPIQFINENVVCIHKNDRMKYISDSLTFPVFRLVKAEDKLKMLPSKPIITCLGDIDLSFITNQDEFDIRVVTFNSDPQLIELLLRSTYMVCHEKFELQIPLSFTTGCKLILPPEILNLKSSIEYSEPMSLNTSPSLFETFNEREELIHARDNSILNLHHMKLFLDYKTTEWR